MGGLVRSWIIIPATPFTERHCKNAAILLGSPLVYVSTPRAPEQTRFPGAPRVQRQGRAHACHDLCASSDSAQVRAWLRANRFPSAFELSRDVFQQVMYAPHRPLVLIVATPRARQEALSTKLTEVVQKWRLGARGG